MEKLSRTVYLRYSLERLDNYYYFFLLNQHTLINLLLDIYRYLTLDIYSFSAQKRLNHDAFWQRSYKVNVRSVN